MERGPEAWRITASRRRELDRPRGDPAAHMADAAAASAMLKARSSARESTSRPYPARNGVPVALQGQQKPLRVLLEKPGKEEGMKPIVVLAIVAAMAGAALPAGAEASRRPEVLCGNFGGQTMPPHLARKPARCDVTVTSGLPAVDYLRHMHWTTWNKHPVGRGLVNGNSHRVRLKKTRPCGQFGEHKVYSKMSIDGRPFRPILYCGD